MPTTAASARTPLRRRFGIPLCAVFVGSGLVALTAPAHADPSPSPTPSPSSSPSSSPDPSPSASPSPSPSAPAPTPSAAIAFHRSDDRVRLGSSAEPNPLTATNNGDAPICLVDLTVEVREFTVEGFSARLVEPGHKADVGQVTGSPRRDTDVVATLAYALADPETGCSAIDSGAVVTATSGAWSVTVFHTEPPVSPTPTPTPTPDPPDESEPPDESDRPTPSPAEPPTNGPETSSPPSSPPPSTPSSPRTPSSPSSSNSSNGSSGSGSGSGSGAGSGSGSGSTPTSRSGVDDVPTSDSEIPTLPRDEADLPGVTGGSEDLAELPLVTPSSDAGDGGTEVAADTSDLGPNWAPAVLLSALLLALLLATPLAPARRVRVGSGYQGKRRKG